MNQLAKVRGEAAYIQLAQKLDTHIKEFDSDRNTQIRWIWQLIQNAKDAPNQFQKVKIKQELNDEYFESMHNGDPFTIKQIHSVVAQYSTKRQQNNEETKTTGKYGTGFITTLILSRIIELYGILKIPIQQTEAEKKMKAKIEQQEMNKHVSTKIKQEQHKIQPSQQKNIESEESLLNLAKAIGLKDMTSQPEKPNLKQEPMEQEIQKEPQQKFHYKQFYIEMDRSYNNRDDDLPKKIQATQNELTRIVQDASYEARHNLMRQESTKLQLSRTIESFDTKLKYKIHEKNKFEMIQKAIQNIKQLLPYALLFNSNLSSYEYLDKREKKQISKFSFTFERECFQNIVPNIYLFTYRKKQIYNFRTSKFQQDSLGYLICYCKGKIPIAAIPIEKSEKSNTVIQVNRNFSQVFKDFPLIGCEQIKWNAVINSNGFYPNQKRSGLMLKNLDQSSLQKVQGNKRHLQFCFKGIKDLYVFLSQQYCNFGTENLLILNHKPSLVTQFAQLEQHLLKNIKQFLKVAFIPTRQTQKTKQKSLISKLHFIEVTNRTYNNYYEKSPFEHKKQSLKANSVFSFLFAEDQTLSDNFYNAFYEILNYRSPYRKYLQQNKFVNFLNLQDCLRNLQDEKKDKLIEEADHTTLHQIYGFIQKCQISCMRYKIYLNQNWEFRAIQKEQLMIKNILPIYDELAAHLGIELKSFIINKQFSGYFNNARLKVKNFTLKDLNVKILYTFHLDELKTLEWSQAIVNDLDLLFRFLLTYKLIPDESIQRIKYFTLFKDLQQFDFKQVGHLQNLKGIDNKLFVTKFIQTFTCYFERLLNTFPSLDLLTTKLETKSADQTQKFLKDLFNDNFIGESLCKIRLKLSLQGLFVTESQLRRLGQEINYPDETDEMVYRILNYQSTAKSLPSQLIAQIYPHKCMGIVRTTTYTNLFNTVRGFYQNIEIIQKQRFLEYISDINDKFKIRNLADKTIQAKYQAWKPEITDRLKLLWALKDSKRQYEDQQKKQFMYDFMMNQNELNSAHQMYKRNGNQLNFQEILSLKAQPSKKIKPS